MVVFDKGCHYFKIANGGVIGPFKLKGRVPISQLFTRSAESVVVRARNGIMWRLFERIGAEEPRFVARSEQSDPLVMRAILSQ